MQDAYTLRRPAAVGALDVGTRAAFLVKTYQHLLGAIAAFTALEIFFFKSGIAQKIAGALAGNWLMVLGAFMLVGWIASKAAHTASSLGVQYLALGGFVVAEAIIFVPLLYVAQIKTGGGVIQSAALVTLMGFTGLSAVVFFTRKDFSFLGSLLGWAGIVALVLIVASLIFGFQLGTIFMVAMIALAGGSILYDTSNVLHHFPQDRYVGASLELFASVALLFWYVLSLFLSRD